LNKLNKHLTNESQNRVAFLRTVYRVQWHNAVVRIGFELVLFMSKPVSVTITR
jgi:hypothetical protein